MRWNWNIGGIKNRPTGITIRIVVVVGNAIEHTAEALIAWFRDLLILLKKVNSCL